MSDHTTKNPSTAEAVPDPSENRPIKEEVISSERCSAEALHESRGHTFVVTTVINETMTETRKHVVKSEMAADNQAAVPVLTDAPPASTSKSKTSTLNADAASFNASKAVVPLSSSLPSKILRLHAKRSAQALLHRSIMQQQSQSLDSQFGSDEGAIGGTECEPNNYSDVFDMSTPSTASLSPPPPSTTPVDLYEEKLVDVGMGSSIEDSEESEEDDELKPLAVDNHVLHDLEADSPVSVEAPDVEGATNSTAVLSEANLEKFHKNHHNNAGYYHQIDNIYMHPNFKYETTEIGEKGVNEYSPPPAVAPANSPTAEPKRVHRSFLTMKKPSVTEDEIIKPKPIQPQTLSTAFVAETESNQSQQPVINEIDSLDPTLIPNDELASEITEAVEFYFSNENILKDAFLLKHVRRNKEGFVSLKLVSSFKRVRQLTKEWKVVGYAVRRKSRKVEVNDLGTKVRRLDPLPNFDETMPSRTIVACDLPLDKLSIEKVSDIFSKCGEIALIRILKPGMTIPVDVRQFMNKYPEMQQKECALVEYLESSSAREAKNLQGPFKVFDMVAPKKKTGKKAIIQLAAPVTRMVENYRYYNDAGYERTRGGSFSGIVSHDSNDLRYKLKRFNSDVHAKNYSDMQHNNSPHYQHHHNPHHHYHQSHHSPTHQREREHFGSEYVHQFQHYQPRGSINNDSMSTQTATAAAASSNNANNQFFAYSPRRYSNTSTISANTAAAAAALADAPPTNASIVNNNNNNISSSNLSRRLSNCSDTYSSLSESRRPSNCSESMSQRRESNCSDNCPCSRRISDFGHTEAYRKISQSSTGSVGGGERRFSNGSLQFDRTFSNGSDLNNSGNTGYPRRMSNDFNYESKQPMDSPNRAAMYDDGNVGGGGGGYNVFPRRYSNNINAANKMAAFDNAQYINGRRISTDSGYDRRYSFGSEYEGSPRSRTGSFLNNYKHGGGVDFDGQPRSRTGSFLDNSPRSRSGSFAQRNAENLVRTPMGPDGSKGFGMRARKFGQTVSPVN